MKEYIGAKQVSRTWEVDYRSVDRIAVAAKVRRLILPGARSTVRYHREDVARVARESMYIGDRPASELAEVN